MRSSGALTMTTARVTGRIVEIPSELHDVMAGAPRLAVQERNGAFYLWPYDWNFVATHRRLALRTRLGRARSLALCDLVELRSDVARYRARDERAPLPRDGDYGLVNKVTNVMLMPLAERSPSAAAVTEKFWADLADYHEHLAVDRQRGFAHRISAWFAEEIVLPLGAGSVLEVGCGAGRNLVHIGQRIPPARLHGVDINRHAVEIATAKLGEGARIRHGSLYELGAFADGSIDVVFSMGVLMHVAHERVAGVIAELQRIARIAVLHFECHGPSHGFDYHKYPRNYDHLYRDAALAAKVDYTIYSHADFRSREARPFHMALLVSRK